MRSWLVYKLSAYLTAGFLCPVTLCCKAQSESYDRVLEPKLCVWWFLQMSCKTDLTSQDSQRFQILNLVDSSWKAPTWIFSSQSEYFFGPKMGALWASLRKKTGKLWTGFGCDTKRTLQQACEVWIVAKLKHIFFYQKKSKEGHFSPPLTTFAGV